MDLFSVKRARGAVPPRVNVPPPDILFLFRSLAPSNLFGVALRFVHADGVV